MDELRQVLGVLRNADPEPAAMPVPTLADLSSLVDTTAGLPVRLAVTGVVDHVPPGVGVSVYRIVQEALTNANRHAGPGASVDVRITCTATELARAHRGQRSRRRRRRGPAEGYGLVGMHERAASAGGTFTAGPRPGGAGGSSARFPLQPGTAAAAAAAGQAGLVIRVAARRRPGDGAPGPPHDPRSRSRTLTVVGEAEDGAAALEVVPRAQPDVVLMDVRMPRMDGIEACTRLRAGAADARFPYVLMLTTFDLEDYVYAALRAGASGFLLKDAPADQLVARRRRSSPGATRCWPAGHPAADRGGRPAPDARRRARASTASPSARSRCSG